MMPPYGDDKGDEPQMPDADDIDVDAYDQYVGADVNLPQGDSMANGRVVGWKRERDGSLKGRADSNPMKDTRTYNVMFPDGSEVKYTANVIAENMWAQADLDGNQYLLLDSIIDHRTTNEALTADKSFIINDGMKYPRKTTKGWEMCIKWKDGTTTWERLADLKESNPIECAEYAVSREIESEPAFNWWVPYILKKQNRIISASSNRYLKRTHKFGV
jgi:hypothetical protein